MVFGRVPFEDRILIPHHVPDVRQDVVQHVIDLNKVRLDERSRRVDVSCAIRVQPRYSVNPDRPGKIFFNPVK